MSNPGNSGYTGYKMSKIVAMTPTATAIAVELACGHIQVWNPPDDMTSEEWSEYLQKKSIKPILVGKTRLRCEAKHEDKPE